MIAVALSGGIGNQMFQYALFLILKSYGKDVVLDISSFNYVDEHNGIEIFNVFDISIPSKLGKEIEYYNAREVRLNKLFKCIKYIGLDKVITKWKLKHLYPLKINRLDSSIPICNIDLGEILDFRKIDNCIIRGTVFPYNLIKENEDWLKNELSFNVKLISDVDSHLYSEILNSNSVSIHVRRGDFVLNNYPILGIDYYNKAIEYIEEHENNLKYYLFTDDKKWCSKVFKSDKFIIVDGNNHDYIDLFLMSNCKYNIIANSSFSWWGAFLNKNPKKIVISPSFLGYLKFSNIIIPDNWVKINTNE